MSSFLVTFVLQEAQTDSAANVTLALEPPTGLGARLIFDIDAYKLEHFDVDSNRIPVVFNSLRDLKNRIFFESLTQRALEPYK
jgi:hypothetical protein